MENEHVRKFKENLLRLRRPRINTYDSSSLDPASYRVRTKNKNQDKILNDAVKFIAKRIVKTNRPVGKAKAYQHYSLLRNKN